MVLLVSFPVVTDDDGTGTTGTPFSAAYNDAIKASVEDNVHSTTNPTIKTKTIIDEVVTARGNKASLTQRLDGVIDADGNFLPGASSITQAQASTAFGTRNMVANDTFDIWPAGDAVAPSYFTVASGTCSRQTAAPAAKIGTSYLRVTRAGADACTKQVLLDSTAFAKVDFLKGKKVSVGCWIYTTVGGNACARVRIKDSASTSTTDKPFQTSVNNWQWVSFTHTMSGSADRLEVECWMETTNGDANFSGLTVIVSDVAPAYWIPCEVQLGTLHGTAGGNLVVATKNLVFQPSRPGIILHAQLRAETAPATQAIIVDINTYDGAALTTAFTTKPQIAAGANIGGAVPDGTYARRCFTGNFNTTLSTGGIITADIDQVGTGTVGADLTIEIRVLQFIRPQEAIMAYNFIG